MHGTRKYFVRRLQEVDARIKIGLSVLTGLCTWQAGPWGLGLFCLAIGALSWLVAGYGLFNRRQLWALVLSVLAWTVLKAGLDLATGEPHWLEASAVLGVRLGVLVLAGLSLAALTSRIQVGQAVNSLLKPVLGRKSWQGAMAMALMIHFIPLTMHTMQRVQQTLAMRGQGLPLRLRLHLYVTTVMRTLSRTTWDQTLAVAVRGLEGPRAWSGSQPMRPMEWGAGLLLGLVMWMASGGYRILWG